MENKKTASLVNQGKQAYSDAELRVISFNNEDVLIVSDGTEGTWDFVKE